ncbi:hypothetical protein [Fundidesulfovibrio agrisoli]|uniref:hypothetical protein n=1 Tax=Fundidesulfovibrio agrisoli TaxID=2922717 RepID=UPI001FACA9E7|nr:hypothetical protein [Fundidesulfovibrio agrisoli]
MPDTTHSPDQIQFSTDNSPLRFHPLNGESAQTIIDAVSPLIALAEFSSGKTVVQAAELPFYEGVKFYALSDNTLPPPNTRYAFHKDGLTVLHDWTNEPIYKLNEELPLILTEQTMIPYVRFFFHYVRGQLGRFIIVENLDEVPWLPEATDDEKAAVEAELMPVSYRGIAPDGMHTLVATVVFKNALFRTNVKIAPQAMDVTNPETGIEEGYTFGQMMLCNEELLLEELAVEIAPPPGEFG